MRVRERRRALEARGDYSLSSPALHDMGALTPRSVVRNHTKGYVRLNRYRNFRVEALFAVDDYVDREGWGSCMQSLGSYGSTTQTGYRHQSVADLVDNRLTLLSAWSLDLCGRTGRSEWLRRSRRWMGAVALFGARHCWALPLMKRLDTPSIIFMKLVQDAPR